VLLKEWARGLVDVVCCMSWLEGGLSLILNNMILYSSIFLRDHIWFL